MRSHILFCLGLVSFASAEAQFDLDRQAVRPPNLCWLPQSADSSTQEETVVKEVNEFVAGVAKNPELQTLDIPAIEKVVPTSVVLAAESDPAKLIEAIVQDSSNTALIGSLPGPVVASLRKLLAKPLKAVADISKYIQQLIASPGVGQALASLEKAVPADLQKQIEANPVPFLENLVTATTVPVWIAAIPTPVQKELASILNKGFSIIEADFANPTSKAGSFTGTSKPKPKPTYSKSKGSPPTSPPYATATASSNLSSGTGTGVGTTGTVGTVATATQPATTPIVSGGSGGSGASGVGGGSGGTGNTGGNGTSTSSTVPFTGSGVRNYQAMGMGVGAVLGAGMFAAM